MSSVNCSPLARLHYFVNSPIYHDSPWDICICVDHILRFREFVNLRVWGHVIPSTYQIVLRLLECGGMTSCGKSLRHLSPEPVLCSGQPRRITKHPPHLLLHQQRLQALGSVVVLNVQRLDWKFRCLPHHHSRQIRLHSLIRSQSGKSILMEDPLSMSGAARKLVTECLVRNLVVESGDGKSK